jgi:hypothetical protein
MRIGTILHALLCLLIVCAYAWAASTGYSPFADASGRNGGGGGGFFFHGSSGPRHK